MTPADNALPAGYLSRGDAVDRPLGLLASVGAALQFAFTFSEYWDEMLRAPTGWRLASSIVVLAILTSLIGFRVLPLTWLRGLWRTIAVLGMLLYLLWIVQGNHSAGQPWITYICPTLVAFAAVSLRWQGAVGYLLLGATATPLLGTAGWADADALTNTAVTVWLNLSNVSHLGIIAAARYQLTLRWTAARDRITTDAELASTQAALAEQARVEGFVHDEVLTALLVASRSPASTDAAQSAHEALDAIAIALADGPVSSADCDLGSSLRLLGTGRVIVDVRGGAILAPPAVAAAIQSAAREAVRNALRHSGSGEHPIHLVAEQDEGNAVRVTITDSGRGFTLEAIDPGRLGIRRSITSRMAIIPGGNATITSQPGAGTIVELTWSPS